MQDQQAEIFEEAGRSGKDSVCNGDSFDYSDVCQFENLKWTRLFNVLLRG